MTDKEIKQWWKHLADKINKGEPITNAELIVLIFLGTTIANILTKGENNERTN